MLLIDALYVNNSGGKVLLDYLVEELEKAQVDVFYLFDARVAGSYQTIPVDRCVYLKASIICRYRFYRANKSRFRKVFCFGNIPPPIKLLDASVLTYFHNILIIDIPLSYSIFQKLKSYLRRVYIWKNRKKTTIWVVQTEYVKNELQKKWKLNDSQFLIAPFFKLNLDSDINLTKEMGTFLYPGSGAPHKNIQRLLAAWELLFEAGYTPELHLTISSAYPILIEKINNLKQKGLRINNHGHLYHDLLVNLYAQSQYVIFPSLYESFGLPLVEGIALGCKILAAELPYTHAIIEPSLVFNPLSVNEIRDTVVKALKNDLSNSRFSIKDQIELLICNLSE